MLSRLRQKIIQSGGRSLLRPHNGIARGSIALQSSSGILSRRTYYTAGERHVEAPKIVQARHPRVSPESILAPVPLDKPTVRTTLDSTEEFFRTNQEYAREMTLPEVDHPRVHGTDFFFYRGCLWATGVDATDAKKVIYVLYSASKILRVPVQFLAQEFSIKNINVDGEDSLSESELVKKNVDLHSEFFDTAKAVTEHFGNEKTRIHLTSHPRNPKLPRAKVEELVKEHGGKIVDIVPLKNIVSAANTGDGALPHDSEKLEIEIPRHVGAARPASAPPDTAAVPGKKTM